MNMFKEYGRAYNVFFKRTIIGTFCGIYFPLDTYFRSVVHYQESKIRDLQSDHGSSWTMLLAGWAHRRRQWPGAEWPDLKDTESLGMYKCKQNKRDQEPKKQRWHV